MKKKLIVCSPQLGISPQSNLGGEVYDREIINAFCQQGVNVIVILPKNKPYLPHRNLKVYYLPFKHLWPPYIFNFLIIPYLFYLYRKHKFNILRIHSPYFVGLGAYFFKLFFPSVSLAAIYHHLEEDKLFYKLINRLMIKKWDLIVTDSKFSRKEITSKYNLRPEKIKVIPPGIDKKYKLGKRSQELIKKYQLEGKKVLLYMGGLKPRKNLPFLLKIINKIRFNYKLFICGSGILENKLKREVKRYKLGKQVILTGFIPEKEKNDYYNLADLFLFPSKKEGFGFAVLEAAACGVPAVVSDRSSLKEVVIDGHTGYLAKFNDLNDWQNKITKLFQNETLREKMGKTARKFARNFSWKKNAENQIKIYSKLLEIL